MVRAGSWLLVPAVLVAVLFGGSLFDDRVAVPDTRRAPGASG